MDLLRRLTVALAAAAGVFPLSAVFADEVLNLETDTSLATAGYYQLRWEAGDVETRLVEATDPSFDNARIIYAGPDTARLMSGKPDGDYYYRLESAGANGPPRGAAVSNTLKVTVAHHSTTRAFSFFTLGAAVFAATLGLIILGGRNERG